MLDSFKPLLRSAKLRVIRARAERLARRPAPKGGGALTPPAFIVGCGRSGTSILGVALREHPAVWYLREPYHLWANVDRRLDVTNLHYRGKARLFMDAADATPESQERFNRLILGARLRAGRPALIEKTPHNVYRIGLIEAFTGGAARWVHIVRDGVDVARSIHRLATTQPYRMAGHADYNQWWGRDHLKWRRLAEEGPPRGYFPDEVARLATDAQKGAYEWLTSLGEADRWRAVLADRLLEITYPQLTADPEGTLRLIAVHVGTEAPAPWLDAASTMISAERRNEGTPLLLPPAMASRFNELQARYGFPGRARTEERA
ncbi:MAG: sulfotransferase [Leptolyngbya sp. PLA2]|nr:sulfotransferase [Leptolyngbya sp.]MCE7971808.1 sulfotransferase [Leptolyngbya sp. PL-A2]MCZ7634450.1 sulfotransferase [Phycisphaerales bacterium]MDL1904753.1 sulfotransferase [Synechococcales cyanobacterium CNB]GIK19765.1 MAG: hypothetical protein BroJett004_19290 [Planctomycetota bacterium]